MINKNELRLGNLTSKGIVTGIPNYPDNEIECDCYSYKAEQVEPIPLSEEWLRKFGFNEIGINSWELPRKMLDIELRKGEKGFIISICNLNNLNDSCKREYLPYECEYVHELQNLIFSIIKEELQITH